MTQHAVVTLILLLILAILLFLAHVNPLLIAAACAVFFGLRGDA